MKYIIGLIIAFGIGCGIGLLIPNINQPKQQSKILINVDKSDTKELYEAYKTPIKIKEEVEGNKRTIIATDKYKQTTYTTSSYNRSIIGGVGISYNNSMVYTYSIGYFQQIKQTHLQIGGMFSVSKNNVGVSVLVGFYF